MKNVFLAALCLLATTVIAQKKNKVAEKFSKTVKANDLKAHLYILAGPEMEGRETGKEGQRKAAEYLKQQFQQFGIAPANKGSYEQFYPLYKDSLIEASVTINNKNFEFGVDFSASLASIYTNQQFFSEVVYMSSVDTTTDISGKVVVMVARNGTELPAINQLQKLYNRQPATVLFVTKNVNKNNSIKSGQLSTKLYRGKQTPIVARISESMGEALLKEEFELAKAQKLETKTIATELTLNFRKDVTVTDVSNVLGMIEGSDKKDEWIIISAHYDHIGIVDGKIHPGADDDGSGTVAVLEIAEAFALAKAAGKGPRRSVLFLAVSGEEKGLWGSAYYASHPIYPLNKTSIDINIDMIGRKDDNLRSLDSNNHIYLIGDDKLSSQLTPFVNRINKTYINLITDRKYNDPNDPNGLYYRSDHYNFAAQGVPIVFFFDGIHKDYHKPTDTPDKINYDLFEKRSRLLFLLAWEAANKETMFIRDLPLHKPAW